MGRRPWGLGIAVWLVGAVATAAHAQVPAVGVPKGVLRLETDGVFEAFDEQFRNGNRESYGASLSSPALGSDRLPGLATVDSQIDRIIGASGSRLILGTLGTDAHADISTAVLGASFGISNRLTIFGRLPLTSQRVQSITRFDPTGADAGLVQPTEQQATFLGQLQTALTTLQSNINAGNVYTTPARKALAEAMLARGTDLLAVLGGATPSAPFAPTASSAAGVVLVNQITGLQDTLSDLGVTGFSDPPPPLLPSAPLTADEFASLLEAGLGYRPGQTQLRYRGDAEAGVAFTLIDHWDRGSHTGGFRTALSTLIRFPTGVRDRSDRLLDLGTGDGQTDVEFGLVTDLGAGRWGARATATYVRQLPADIAVRVTSPTQPLVGPERLALVRWNPGDIVAVSVRPFYRLVSTLGIQAGVDLWRRGTDEARYTNPADAIPGVEASLITTDSKASATTISAGLTYTNLGALRPGGRGLPVEASWLFERVVRSGEGIVPAVQRVRATLRLYFQLFE